MRIGNQINTTTTDAGACACSLPGTIRALLIQNPHRLRGEALVQVEEGRFGNPIIITISGLIHDIHPEGVNIDLRFGDEQADRLRACDDHERNWANLPFSVWGPITLPTWGHIAQSALNLRKRKPDWEFPKADRASAYKNRLLRPGLPQISFASIRSPVDGQRYAFPPRSLFGAISEVLHYNCSPHILTFLTYRSPGIPLVGYCDDYWEITPGSLSRPGLSTFNRLTAFSICPS